MERIELYNIDLKNLRETSTTYTYKIDDEFFKLIDATDIQKGELDVTLTVKKEIGAFKLSFHIEGYVVGICDRCLDEVEIDVDTDNTLKVKLGNEFSDDDEIITIPESEGYINVAWNIYEFAYLSLPCRIVHEEGECNEEMQEALNNFIRYDKEDADHLKDDESESNDDPLQETDSRWNALKKILNNN